MTFGMFATSGRGGHAPRRGRGGKPAPMFNKHSEVKPDLLKHPLGDLLATFSNSDLEPTKAGLLDNVAIKNCNYVGSYNWIDTKSPTIMVPGKPPRWTPLKEPKPLKEDSGQYFRDPNAARFPGYPTEPAVHALFQTDPDFPTSEVDIFGCGNTIGNLLRFVRSMNKPFRFSVEAVGNTVFFIRKENDPKETIKGVVGFGHTFPEAYTTWESDVKGSESHQRLVQYEFGGLNCVVRFECDGYIGNLAKSPSNDNSGPILEPKPKINDILESFENATVGMTLPNTSESITIRTGGGVPSQDTIFDLKTRSGRYGKRFDLEDIYPVLWLKQIPNFIIAYHDGAGLFEDVQVNDVRQGVRQWENKHKADIQRLAVLLKKIVAIAQQSDTKLLDVYSPSVDRLEIRKQDGEGSHALPSDLMARWERAEDTFDALEDPHDPWGQGEEEDAGFGSGGFSDSDDELDFTACSADDCGYCGKCTY
ncbi:hypothetical protein CC80DRAFT_564944 [Byssothecium circinans]|uniref:Geranylgeranyl pyrophosphate synthetase n=1 Tax=Byssothecium circinans TaxID=147558 RepID=A0A6A5U2F4_9PLEO|nr:hypothetical protein CC80DRAFT_564944 [Byssothecium circinans]